MRNYDLHNFLLVVREASSVEMIFTTPSEYEVDVDVLDEQFVATWDDMERSHPAPEYEIIPARAATLTDIQDVLTELEGWNTATVLTIEPEPPEREPAGAGR